MWWFAVLYFVNAVAPHHSLVYNDNFRIVLGGIPFNILDGLVLLAGVMSILPIGTRQAIPRVHPAWSKGLTLLALAFVIGVAQSYIFFPDLPPRFRLPIIRNFVLTPICLYIGYRCLSQPRQIRTAFWIVFLSSIGSAIASIITQGMATSELGEASRAEATFDMLRQTALDIAGDAGLLAACAILFAMVSGVARAGKVLSGLALIICMAGMFLIPHRSSWLLDVIAIIFAGFILWPVNMGRKIATNLAVYLCLALAGMVLAVIIQAQTDRDLVSWTEDRLASLLPGEEKAHESKAWDTRLPGMMYELRLAMWNPVLGRGFGAPEDQAIKDAEYHSFRHTPWVTTLCETGAVGLAGFGIVIVGLWVVGTRMARQGPDKWCMLLGATGASWGAVCFFAGFFTLHWDSPRQAITLGVLAGLMFRARDLSMAMMPQAQQLPLLSSAGRFETSYA